MKILIIRNHPSYMDVKFNTYNIQEIGLAKALIRKGHQCDIVFWTDKEEYDYEIKFDENYSLKIYYRKSKVVLKNAIFTNINSLIEKYDIIQPCEYNQLQSWLLAKKYPNKTVIYHGPYYSKFNMKYNLMCKFIDFIVIPTYKKKNTIFLTKSELARTLLINKGILSKHIVTAGVGIDLDALSINKQEDIPEDLKIIDSFKSKYKLLYIGRIEERRNILFLLKILKILKQQGMNAVLIMIGNGDSDYCNKCISYARENKIEENICWIRNVEQKYLSYIYKNSDVFLLPTQYEIFGMVLLEAMYFGLPVITTKNGGSEMLISNLENGIIINEFNAEIWCEEIKSLKNNTSVGIKAHQYIEQNFTWDSLCKIFIDLYKKRI